MIHNHFYIICLILYEHITTEWLKQHVLVHIAVDQVITLDRPLQQLVGILVPNQLHQLQQWCQHSLCLTFKCDAGEWNKTTRKVSLYIFNNLQILVVCQWCHEDNVNIYTFIRQMTDNVNYITINAQLSVGMFTSKGLHKQQKLDV